MLPSSGGTLSEAAFDEAKRGFLEAARTVARFNHRGIVKEQYGSRAPFGAYTDVYALGATLYHLLTDVVPVESFDRVIGIPLVEPARKNAQVSKTVSDAVVKSMAINAHDRFQTIGAFLDEFEVSTGSRRSKRSRWKQVALSADDDTVS